MSFMDSDFSFDRRECVKRKATKSVMIIKGLPFSEATKVVEKGFDRCYRDVEPFGRMPMTKKCEELALRDFMDFAQLGKKKS